MSEYREYYRNIIPILKALGKTGGFTTLGVHDHYGWYKEETDQNKKLVRPYELGNDAEELIENIERSYYAVLNYQESEILSWEPCTNGDNSISFEEENPLPDYEDINALALFVDIDLKGEHKERPLPQRKKEIFEKVVEEMVLKFKEFVGEDYVFALDSVGGAYILTVPWVTLPLSDLDDSGEIFQEVRRRMNDLIAEKGEQILESVTGAEDICKVDAIINKNRKYKAPLSLHKEIEGVVHPLDTEDIRYRHLRPEEIDDELISEVEEWCEDFTRQIDSTDPIDKLISVLFSDFYDGDWRDALTSWLTERRKEKKRQKRLRNRLNSRYEERNRKNISLDDMEKTSHVEDVIDAVNRLDIREIVKKYASDEYDTSNRTSEITFNPSWRDSESGKSCAIPHGDNKFIDNEVNESVGTVKAYALGVGIIHDATESLQDRKFWRAVEGLRMEGYDIPILEDQAETDSEFIALLGIPSGKPFIDGSLMVDNRPSQRYLQEVREKTLDTLIETLERCEDTLIDALPGTGKSHGIIKAAKETQTPVTIFTNRGQKEQYAQYERWCEVENLSHRRLPSFLESCPTANGEHGEGWKEKVMDWYERGLTPQQIHEHVELPCQKDDSCPWSRAWDFDPESYDVLIGHYKHAHLPTVTMHRVVVFDEFPENSFESRFSDASLKRSISTFLEEEEELLFDDFTDILENRKDEEKREKTLNYLQDQDRKRDVKLVIDTEDFDVNTSLIIKALLDVEEKGGKVVNGFERKHYFLKNKTVLHDRGSNEIYILNHPNLYHSQQILALDGTPTLEMWKTVLSHMGLNDLQVMDKSEREEFIKKGLQHRYVRTTEDRKPYSSGEWVKSEKDKILLEKINDMYEEKPSLITTQKAEKKYREDEVLDYVKTATHYGNLKGSNKLKNKRLGVVIGSQHYGDQYIKRWAAYMDGRATRSGKGRGLDYGEIGNKIYQHMTHNATLQAAMRFGRDGRGAVVFIDTSALPTWVPHETRPGVIKMWSEGLEKVYQEVLKHDEFVVQLIANNVDLSKRQVRRALNELQAKTDALEKDDSTRPYKWKNKGLDDVVSGGWTKLTPLDASESESNVTNKEEKQSEMVIRVEENIPDFEGYEHNYNLSTGDVLTLPSKLAEELTHQDKAVKIQTNL